jgi:hypothetical protein
VRAEPPPLAVGGKGVTRARPSVSLVFNVCIRRVREWRALHGPEQEVYFPQDHPPGREAAFDFTNCNDLGVSIGSEPFAHLLFELALSYSGWRWRWWPQARATRPWRREYKERSGSWAG